MLFIVFLSFIVIDISLIYHMIRGQGTIKLYVVYNVLEVSDSDHLGFKFKV